MEFKTLSNGVQMPMLGYGVFQIDDATTERCVEDAIASGYRMIDTAQAYGNERGVGAGIKASGVARDELFVVSKVWVSNYGEGKTYDSIRRSLDLLDTGHIDLMLLHQAYNDYHAAWRDMERAYADGLVRAIGVSNFDPTRLLDLCTFAEVAPMVNQVETHVFWQQHYAHENMENLGVAHMAWGPFAEGANNFFQNPLLAEIGAAHGKSVGQIALRYLLDLGVIVIPKTTHKERMDENLSVFDFDLTDDEKSRIAELDLDRSICYDHRDVQLIGGLLQFVKGQIESGA
ncbi:MAG TPA: aldo/keto reductase [Candidatus Olsenella pullistercoris]|uniref:Aldo/keto reductase n=1 Tax=Candidatus Olsenella pullistercoris TaxID=2838712 RepID=A0A9D2EYJ6_9ACTN|nr:aldo/keto reductase [Candidatus Olsenella pullistercoris]